MNKHKWYMGWPGNFCLKCGADDPIELAMAMGWYEPLEDKYDIDEHKELVKSMLVNCPFSD